jgi:predicted RNase H-like HicB family nuclease
MATSAIGPNPQGVGGNRVLEKLVSPFPKDNFKIKYKPYLKGGIRMERVFSLEYWIDDNWYVGRLKEVPGVFSQEESLQELEENIREAYQLMLEEEEIPKRINAQIKEIEVRI